ncbi:LOW QUALITY PROTEIN: hypothetical protein U9M48_002387 [Paspalum notatum var. saurae]|uniref:Uncharacterized protein n=1 Tax=Paspalum notatum var. saurae TaxID=547442 RepID=A0AAQ3SJ10_PASNO
MGSAPSAVGHPPAGTSVDTASGHRHEQINRVNGSGVITTLHPHPIKGTSDSTSMPHNSLESPDSTTHRMWESGGSSSSIGRLPKLQFPIFDGSQLIYRSNVSIERRLASSTLRNIMLYLCASCFTSNNVARCRSTLSNSLNSWISCLLMSLTMIPFIRFIDGPVDLDTACLIAQLQEEVGDSLKKEFHRTDGFSASKPGKPAYPLPLPPLKTDVLYRPHQKLKHHLNQLKSGGQHCVLFTVPRAYFCAEKWTRGHKCADTVQLNVIQKVLELFQVPSDPHSDNSDTEQPSEQPSEQLFLTLSVAAFLVQLFPKLSGQIQGHMITILVDSRSSHTFISAHVASQLTGLQSVVHPLQVANGHILQCSSQLPNASWSVHQYHFCSDFKVLPLYVYDMILGLDRLDKHSPMQVHWQQKWLSIPYNSSTVILYGILPQIPESSLLQVCAVDSAVDTVSASQLPEIQCLLDEFSSLFAASTGLPPPRDCDHTIPLIPGTSPVFIRPYRLTPALKDEVEVQIKEMLHSGIIQKSTSPFSSAVLLVKKKDNTWRFCVDYQQLNAITIKSKYLVPIIDELLDELFEAQGTFLSAMNSTLGPFLKKFILVFLDDILIYSKTYEEHLVHL